MDRNKGFSLLEVLLATTIIAIGITVLMTMFQASYVATMATEEQNLITMAVNSQAQRLMGASAVELQTEFGGGFTGISFFHVDGFAAAPADSSIGTIAPQPSPSPPPYDPYNGGWNVVTSKTGIASPVFASGREPAQGFITPVFPPTGINPPPPTPNDLVEFDIRIDYISYTGEPRVETAVIWVSPQF